LTYNVELPEVERDSAGGGGVGGIEADGLVCVDYSTIRHCTANDQTTNEKRRKEGRKILTVGFVVDVVGTSGGSDPDVSGLVVDEGSS